MEDEAEIERRIAELAAELGGRPWLPSVRSKREYLEELEKLKELKKTDPKTFEKIMNGD